MGYKLNTSLSPEELEHRRYLLNEAGFIAWISPILVLALLYLYRTFLSKPIAQSSSKRSKVKEKAPSPFVQTYRRISWLLNHTYPPTSEFGPLGVPLVGLVYLLWLLTLSIRNTGQDYMHLTKAVGHVAVSQLPIHYLLSIKSPQNPITLATGLTHERLNAYHRLCGRIIHALLATHALMYLNFFFQLGVLEQRIKNPVVRLGLTAFWITNFLGIFALPVVRKKLYNGLFFRSHVILSAALPVVVWFHVPYTRWYVAQAGAFWIANGLARWRASSDPVKASVKLLERTDLIKLSIPTAGTSEVNNFVPGQHVYIKRVGTTLGPRTPFTIVSVSPDGRDSADNPRSSMELVVRNLQGPQTGWLAANRSVDIIVEGPYGEASDYVPILLRDSESAGSVLLIAGGVGATYTLPIYLSLLRYRKANTVVSFVWFVRSINDAEWGIEMLSAVPSAVNVDIYITKNEEGIGALGAGRKAKDGLKIYSLGKRPEMGDIVEKVFSATVGNKGSKPSKKNLSPVTVLACGPPSMSQSLRNEVGKHVMGYGRDVRFHEEQFGLGSS